MNEGNKNKILNWIKTGGAIDKVAPYYYVGSGVFGISTALAQTITWGAASGGVLTNSAAVDIENSGATITIQGVVLYSSTVAVSNVDDCVAKFPFATQVVLDDGEILRLNTVTYTID
jgi:hypothetical protein